MFFVLRGNVYVEAEKCIVLIVGNEAVFKFATAFPGDLDHAEPTTTIRAVLAICQRLPVKFPQLVRWQSIDPVHVPLQLIHILTNDEVSG